MGRLKHMAARPLLLKLHAKGWIELPPPRMRTARPCAPAPRLRQPELRPCPPASIEPVAPGSLGTALPNQSALGSPLPLRPGLDRATGLGRGLAHPRTWFLCKGARGHGRRLYGRTKFTPEEVRRRDSLARWQTCSIFHGGCYRQVRFKELSSIYWRNGERANGRCACWWPPPWAIVQPARTQILSPTGLPADHQSDHCCGAVVAGLLRS
jgi:hypothetical protein